MEECGGQCCGGAAGKTPRAGPYKSSMLRRCGFFRAAAKGFECRAPVTSRAPKPSGNGGHCFSCCINGQASKKSRGAGLRRSVRLTQSLHDSVRCHRDRYHLAAGTGAAALMQALHWLCRFLHFTAAIRVRRIRSSVHANALRSRQRNCIGDRLHRDAVLRSCDRERKPCALRPRQGLITADST